EQRARRTTESRALGLHARSLEAFDLRGIADRFLAKGHPSGYIRITVGSARIDFSGLKTDFQQLSICPQSVTEAVLEERACELGSRVERGARVVDIAQDPESVTLTVLRNGSTSLEQARWVVGCDGSQSTVRKSVGIGFPGKSYPYNVIVGDLHLANPPDDGMLIKVSPHGLVVAIDFGNGWWRMGAVNFDKPDTFSHHLGLEELLT